MRGAASDVSIKTVLRDLFLYNSLSVYFQISDLRLFSRQFLDWPRKGQNELWETDRRVVILRIVHRLAEELCTVSLDLHPWWYQNLERLIVI